MRYSPFDAFTEPKIVRCPTCGELVDIADIEDLVKHMGPHDPPRSQKSPRGIKDIKDRVP